MGLFGNGNIKTSMFLVEGLPSSFKAVIRMELDKKAQKLLFKLPQEKEFRELPFSQILYARRDRLIDKQKDLNELALKIISGIIQGHRAGCRSQYELAELLGVTEKFLQDAINCYRSKYGAIVQLDDYTIMFEPCLAVIEKIE